MGARACIWWLLISLAGGCSEQADLGERGSEAPSTGLDMDAGPGASDASAGTACVVADCPVPTLGVACCTAPGTGAPGNILEPVGRGPDLCGTNLGSLAESLEDVCVQLDQPGVLDPDCPGQAPISGGETMRGCCTDEGFCGSFDERVPFGCFYAAGMRGAPCGPDGDEDAGL